MSDPQNLLDEPFADNLPEPPTVPEAITGADFLAQYGGFTDHATTIDPRHIYAVRHPAAHPIYENHRVRLFRALLHSPLDEERLRLLGELMYQSHASYSACGLGSDGTDRLVDMVRAAGPRARPPAGGRST